MNYIKGVCIYDEKKMKLMADGTDYTVNYETYHYKNVTKTEVKKIVESFDKCLQELSNNINKPIKLAYSEVYNYYIIVLLGIDNGICTEELELLSEEILLYLNKNKLNFC